MSLDAKLEAIREGEKKRIPPERREIMQRVTRELRESDLMDGVPKVGDPLPAFALKNAQGSEVRSSDLLSKGAVVLTVFRGSW